MRAIIETARPHVSELVGKFVSVAFDRPFSGEDLRIWREQVNSHVASDAGFAYQAYVRLKLASVRAFGAELILKLRGIPALSPLSRVVAEIIDAWAIRKQIVYEDADREGLGFEIQTGDARPPWVHYLLAFDVKYRVRRLQFLIEGQNRLYQLIGQKRFAPLDPQTVDRLKRRLYDRLDALRHREESGFYSEEARRLAAEIPPNVPSAGEMKDVKSYAERFVNEQGDKVDALIQRLAQEIDLNATTRDLDHLLASLDPAEWHPEPRREVLINYLGFPFWDVLTFPITGRRENGELREILIDRISPNDASESSTLGGVESSERHRVWPLRRISFARLPRERLPHGPATRARPADRHRLQLRRGPRDEPAY